MATIRKRRLSPQARRALVMISSIPRGAAEELLMLRGFKSETLAELVLAGLATVVTETVQAGAPTIKVERYRITDDGRRAIEG
jgi:hypothetical protein